jgi:nitrogen fixation/metabolism regulation signal transduction histidine kinase
MIFSRGSPLGFAAATSARATAIAIAVFCALLASERAWFATAGFLLVLAAFLATDLLRSTAAADRVFAQFVENLTAEGYERPAAQPGLARLSIAISVAMDHLAEDRAQREERLDRLQALVDTVPVALLVVDRSGMVLSVNRAAQRHLRVRVGPLAAITTLSPTSLATVRTMPPGAMRILQLADGRSVNAQTAAFTAGRQRLLLLSLQGFSGDLDGVAQQAWEDLARVLAHEIMNSLTPICSLSQVLGRRLGELDGAAVELAEDAEVIRRRSAGLISFVERYRQITHLPNPNAELVDVRELGDRVERLFGPTAQAAGVAFSIRIATTAMQADPTLIEQALINLLKNAIEAAGLQTNGRVDLIAEQEGDLFCFTVSDNGAGIAPECRERIFVPFFTTKPDGSGVGLTLARQIALAHGGRLEYRQTAGGGASFRLCLPAIV